MSTESPEQKDTAGEIKRRHLHAASNAISRRKRRLYIGGEWLESERRQTFKTHDPTTGNILAEVQSGSAADIDRAVDAAWDAHQNYWSEYSVTDRQNVLNEIADRVESNKERFAVLDTLDNGKPITESRHDIDLFVDQFRYFAGSIRTHEGRIVPTDESHQIQVIEEPYGVVGQIIPWNFPMLMVSWKLAPALAAGNTAVIKPAEQTPLSILELMRVIDDILPPGVVNVVTGYGTSAGSPLVKHEDVPKIAFTGSTEVGQGVIKSAAASVTDLTLELGGKSPVIVYPDMPAETAAEIARDAIFFNAGETCSAGSRLFVHETVAAEFTEAFLEEIDSIVLGDPLEEETDLGPQVDPSQANKTMQYVESLREQGAEILTGGYEPNDDPLSNGCFVAPTAISDVSHAVPAVQEEIFGPVEVMFTWGKYDEMIKLANDVNYGLAAGIITQDQTEVHRAARDLEAGNIWVNTYNEFPAGQPFGGVKQSGSGREVSLDALGEYTQTKTINKKLVQTDQNW